MLSLLGNVRLPLKTTVCFPVGFNISDNSDYNLAFNSIYSTHELILLSIIDSRITRRWILITLNWIISVLTPLTYFYFTIFYTRVECLDTSRWHVCHCPADHVGFPDWTEGRPGIYYDSYTLHTLHLQESSFSPLTIQSLYLSLLNHSSRKDEPDSCRILIK